MPTLTAADYDEIARELDSIWQEVRQSLGAADAAYIRRVITVQRGLELSGRILLFAAPRRRGVWLTGVTGLAVAKILENFEIGHNVMHGQWDWMRDPKIHSTTWEWDTVCPSAHWKHSHNVIHHNYTNVVGKDPDVGYRLLRISPLQPWHPVYLAQPFYNVLLALLQDYAFALHDLRPEDVESGVLDQADLDRQVKEVMQKIGRQAAKDYFAFPLLSGRNFLPTLLGNLAANAARNVWSHTVIHCGHFPAGVETFTQDVLENETKGQWYVRQLRGSGNIRGGRLFDVLSGNLSHQIEHHLFPDLPSNRYAQIAPRVRALCAKYDLPYTTGRLSRQIGSTWFKVVKYALPNAA